MKSKQLLKELSPLLVWLLLLSVPFLTIFFYNHPKELNIQCQDGDTFAINDTWYRLAYIDTPEKGYPGYKAASKFTCDYLQANKDNLSMESLGKEKYGRELVIIGNNEEQTILNMLLISNCLAEPFYGKSTSRVVDLYNNNCK